MEVEDIHLASLSGYCFNTEEKTALRQSTTLLKDAEKLGAVQVWGKILGVQKDYIVVQTFNDDFLVGKKYFYRFDDHIGSTYCSFIE
jgi:hypothetical protein